MRKMPKWLEKKKKFCGNESQVVFWRRCGPYLIIHEKIGNEPQGGKGHTLMRSAYTPEGLYIGPTRLAYRFWKKYGITRFFGNSSIAFVGQSDKHWHGWSHRAIGKFKKGEWKYKGNLPHEGRAYRITNPRKTAFAFAESVS